jgi:methyl-accepting chemotaxis protein
MQISHSSYIRPLAILFLTILILAVGSVIVLLSFFDQAPWVATAIAITVIGLFVLFGLIGFALIKKQISAPMETVVNIVSKTLAGDYSSINEDAIRCSIPGLGDQVADLVAQYKERLGFSRSILEGLPIPIAIVDLGQHITFLNRECLQMLGSTEDPEKYYGRMISQVFYHDDRKSKIADCMESDTRAMNLSAIFKHVNESDIHVLINLFPLHDVEGKVIGGCCLYMDTTELKRREAEIVSQNERIATAANEATVVSEELAAAASQLGTLVAQARDGACTQTERTGETATAMEEMNATVLEVARHAQEAAEDADEARGRADEGSAIVAEVVTAINEVAEHAIGLKGSMEELDQRSEEIGKVLSVIEDIADQTNLLALNAAIEAARAGEAGRGFAVVADEVRKLAEKTMQATNEVHAAITGIQDGARRNVRATEIAVSSVEKSTEMASRSGEALSAIVNVAEATSDRVRSIATAAEQQSATSEEINRATTDVTRVCGETDLIMLDASEAITRLSSLAEELTLTIRKMQ